MGIDQLLCDICKLIRPDCTVSVYDVYDIIKRLKKEPSFLDSLDYPEDIWLLCEECNNNVCYDCYKDNVNLNTLKEGEFKCSKCINRIEKKRIHDKYKKMWKEFKNYYDKYDLRDYTKLFNHINNII